MTIVDRGWDRRQVLGGIAGVSGAALAGLGPAAALSPVQKMMTRPIPSSGEKLPMVGIGTSRVFDVPQEAVSLKRLREVLQVMLSARGSVIDTSPMYGAAEAVAGTLVKQLNARKRIFIATKVWTSGREEGIAQMRRSMRHFNTDKIELMQIHNLVDWKTQLKTCLEWKEKGLIRYVGVTHYTTSAFEQLASILKDYPIDFVQMPYSIVRRDAERLLMPVAQERKVAVMTHRNFERGRLFRTVRGKTMPAWAQEAGIRSWGQFFLKFVLSHPASTCVIPGTSKVRHMTDNIGAGMGRLPDATLRERMARLITDS